MDRIPLLTQILAQNPADPFARYGLAMAYADADQPEQALAEYATIRRDNPDYVPAYQMAAQLLIRLDRPEDARDYLTHGLQVAARTRNTHAAAEMQGLLDDLA